MSSLTGRCPACDSAITSGDERCAACEQVLGEANLCDRCHALAPALVRGVELCCSACGATRDRAPGVIIANASEIERALHVGWPSPWSKLAPAALLVAVLLLVFTQVLTLSRSASLVLNVLAGLALLAAGAAGLRVRHQRALWQRRRRFVLDQHIVGLACQQQGVLSAAHVARALALDASEADARLGDLVARARATIEVGESGQVTYVFRDVKPTRGIRIRGRDSTTGSHRFPPT